MNEDSAAAEAAASFEPHRGPLKGLAYRMLGSMAEAEDAVQDAYLRWLATDRSAVRNARAFLTKTVARLCLDQLKSAQAQREVYVGPWLPEPILDESALSPEAASEFADDLSYALLLALERLSPLERAAFLLHDVFDLEFDQVAEALNRNPAAVRQLASRARTHVQAARPRFQPTEEERNRVFAAFAAALDRGDVQELTKVLAEDAVFYADGGGKVAAAQKPLHGAANVAKFLGGIVRKNRGKLLPPDAEFRAARVNGRPGIIIIAAGQVLQTLALELRDGLVAAIYTVRNPDKLRGLALR